jgi:hypothetical protein
MEQYLTDVYWLRLEFASVIQKELEHDLVVLQWHLQYAKHQLEY